MVTGEIPEEQEIPLTDTEKIEAIQELLGTLNIRQMNNSGHHEWITVQDSQYFENNFLEDLFEIINR